MITTFLAASCAVLLLGVIVLLLVKGNVCTSAKQIKCNPNTTTFSPVLSQCILTVANKCDERTTENVNNVCVPLPSGPDGSAASSSMNVALSLTPIWLVIGSGVALLGMFLFSSGGPKGAGTQPEEAQTQYASSGSVSSSDSERESSYRSSSSISERESSYRSSSSSSERESSYRSSSSSERSEAPEAFWRTNPNLIEQMDQEELQAMVDNLPITESTREPEDIYVIGQTNPNLREQMDQEELQAMVDNLPITSR